MLQNDDIRRELAARRTDAAQRAQVAASDILTDLREISSRDPGIPASARVSATLRNDDK